MPQFFKPLPINASSSENLATSDSSGGGANAVVSLSAPATTGRKRVLNEVMFSYSTTPETGGLKVFNGTSSGALMLDLAITADGPDAFFFPPLAASQGKGLTVELLQAGSSITGKLVAYGDIL